MNILSNFSVYTPNRQNYASHTFESAKARKLIEKLANSKQLKKEKITFDELESMYNEIGYDVFKKRGSHAVVSVPTGINIAVVIPHGDKYVSPYDLKRFLLIRQGKFEEAAKA